jgi:hypothetical protein
LTDEDWGTALNARHLHVEQARVRDGLEPERAPNLSCSQCAHFTSKYMSSNAQTNSVMHAAVGQRRGPPPARIMRSEDLRHRAAAVVGDEIDLVEARRIVEIAHHRGLRGEAQIKTASDARVAQPHEIAQRRASASCAIT